MFERIRTRLLLIGIHASLTLAAVSAAPVMCADIQDAAARLTCYDAAAGKTSPAHGATVVAKTPEARAGYALNLQRALLSAGMNFQVMAPERRDPKSAGNRQADKFPMLIVFGPLDNSVVFQLIRSANILGDAKVTGFSMVQFFSKAGGGGWWFDLSGTALPQCDQMKRLCL